MAASTLEVKTLPFVSNLAALRACYPERYPALLESAVRGTPRARFDILFAFPQGRLCLQGSNELFWNGQHIPNDSFLNRFESFWQKERRDPVDELSGIPFRGGWFVFLGYELAREIESNALPTAVNDFAVQALAVRIPAAAIVDHELGCVHLVAEKGKREYVEAIEFDLRSVEPVSMQALSRSSIDEERPENFLQGVEKVKNYIQNGDAYQVNLSRQWRAVFEAPPASHALYQRLRQRNPAPFSAWASLSADHVVMSSSPERLVSVKGNTVSTRPIAGTYPRGHNVDDDERLARELLRHPKERAEHVMLIDLERNDLGRVCKTGTVRVSDFMTLETYPHVHHIVSEVGGRLRPGMTPVDVIRAVFPGGTITGCPKVRCMQIIHEIEATPRGPYTGSLGYVNHDGDLDLNILIRTMTLHGRDVKFRAGAGIVADSVPQRELEETRAKARGMLNSLEP